MEKIQVELNILGHRITARSMGDKELVTEAAELARIKLADAEKRVKTGSAHEVTALALLDLAEDYLRAKKKMVEFRKHAIEKSDRLIELMEKME